MLRAIESGGKTETLRVVDELFKTEAASESVIVDVFGFGTAVVS